MNAQVCDKYHDPELTALRTDVREKSATIKAMVKGVHIPLAEGGVTVTALKWAMVPQANVRLRLCTLDVEDPEHTAVNAVFDTGGVLGPHHHPEELTIFCISGEVLEVFSKQTIKSGEVMKLDPNQKLGLASDRAYLTITWKPPLKQIDTE